ncbi:MAG: histidine--tRNA ligase [Candidatus Pacebacteria bacterium]|nr:histidine--tRNA ligase [Candidatus Paceibacterota bacterium]
MKKLETAPYKGVRDFYPKDMTLLSYIFSNWKKVVESFGYEEYSASPLEPTELYAAKTGEEIVNEQTYTFKDRGDRSVTLRPEMTPTVARMVAHKENELPFPLRWYSVPNVFRYEKPQKGRLREHFQLNVDLFGVDNIEADVEVINVAYSILKKFGAKDSDFVIKINNRKILGALFDSLKISKEKAHKISKVIDKKEKISPAAFETAIEEYAKGKTETLISNLESNQVLIQTLGNDHGEIVKLMKLIEALDKEGIKNVSFTPTLMRGFDYYTGIVFEIFDTSEENSRSLFGGGRYNDLLDIFGKRKIPTIGFGMGDVTLKDFLETHDLLPNYKSNIIIHICVITEEARDYANSITKNLRENGIKVSIDISGKKISDQIKYADKKDIPFVICIGEDEVENKILKVKNIPTHEEKEVKEDDLVSFFRM